MTSGLSYREVVGILQLISETREFGRVDAQVGRLKLSFERERPAERSARPEREPRATFAPKPHQV